MKQLSLVCLIGILLVPMSGVTSGTADPAPASRSGSKPLRFLLDSPLYEGAKTRVRLRNTGDVPYVYNSYYEACQMVFRDAAGRRFLVPEGTHCDLEDRSKLAPGETVTLFRWGLDECVKDEWGCTKARDLSTGRYSMRGWFRPKGGGDQIRVTRRFHIR